MLEDGSGSWPGWGEQCAFGTFLVVSCKLHGDMFSAGLLLTQLAKPL